MTDNPHRVRTIRYADGTVEDLDAMRRATAAAEGWRRSAANAESLVTRIKAGELAWDGTKWVTPAVALVDHTDPDQIRRAAGVIEGIGMDWSSEQPHTFQIHAAALRHHADRLESEATADDVDYPETLAVAKIICESLPSDDPGGVEKPWEQLTEEEQAPFILNARNLGYVFPEQYPKLAAELAQYRAGS